MTNVNRTRRWLRRPLRQKWWAVENWLHGYKFGPIRRHRCCDHTTPSHYAWCSRYVPKTSPWAEANPAIGRWLDADAIKRAVSDSSPDGHNLRDTGSERAT